jgi:hypothetical protein
MSSRGYCLFFSKPNQTPGRHSPVLSSRLAQVFIIALLEIYLGRLIPIRSAADAFRSGDFPTRLVPGVSRPEPSPPAESLMVEIPSAMAISRSLIIFPKKRHEKRDKEKDSILEEKQ